MSFHRYYNTFQNMNRQSQSQNQDELHNLISNTNNIVNIQSQVITNLNSNIVNLTRMIYNLENQLVDIQNTLNNNHRNRADPEIATQTDAQELPSFNRIPNNTTSHSSSNVNNLNEQSNVTNINLTNNQTNQTSANIIPNRRSQISQNIQSNLRYLPPRSSQTTSNLLDNLLDDIILGSPPPSRRTVRPRRYPEIMEVTYSVDSRPSRSLVDLFRTINNEQPPDNLITTHETISRNTEVYTYSNANNNDNNDNDEASEDTVETCVICQEPLEDGCIMRKIKKCNHSFHMNCLDIWLERKITCPTCRADIRENDNSNDRTELNEDTSESEGQGESSTSRTI